MSTQPAAIILRDPPSPRSRRCRQRPRNHPSPESRPASSLSIRRFGRSDRRAHGTRSPGRWRENEPPPAPPVSNRDDDLADLLVRLQIAVSLDDFLKRERLGDERLEATRGESVIHERLRPFQTLRVA